MSVVTFPDAAAVVLERLRIALPALQFAHEVPNPRPAVFIRIYRVGGPEANLVVDAALLAIESWAPDAGTAAANAEQVRGHLRALPEQAGQSPQVYRVRSASGPAELPDPSSQSRRVTWTAEVLVRGH
jgi:hypothetical protein